MILFNPYHLWSFATGKDAACTTVTANYSSYKRLKVLAQTSDYLIQKPAMAGEGIDPNIFIRVFSDKNTRPITDSVHRFTFPSGSALISDLRKGL